MRRIVAATRETVGDIAEPCRSCLFWQSGAGEHPRGCEDKDDWISQVLLEWGSCGSIAYVDEVPAGHVLFAPARFVPRADAFATSPVSDDAVLLVGAAVAPQFAGQGLGRVLIQTVARDAVRHGVRAIEAFGTRRAGTDCLVPVDFLLAVGFKIVRPHPVTPRLRLDLRSTLRWREDIEHAVERLLVTIGAQPSRA